MTAELFEKYSHKIVSREDLLQKIGAFPRARKLIMCHGVFDVVHPGHVRHLAYAKSKADHLLVSITRDEFIRKGMYRPHVPEDLRALNIAAFEMVDFVVIDDHARPLENVAFIKPDFFAKGFEYSAQGLPPESQEEMELVESYGGEMMFTPGDVVYSSSNLIEMALPDIGLEKLLTLMSGAGVDFDALRAAVLSGRGKTVHVVGDTIVDSYTRTTLIGGQTKTPTFSVLHQGCDEYIGGAGVVALHMRAAGAEVVFSTVLGEDKYKSFVLEGLEKAGVTCRAIIDPTRPTTNKNVIVAEGYRLLKIDTLDNRSISKTILEKLTDQIRTTDCDAVVMSDFRHGLYNRQTIPTLTSAIADNVFKVADSQVATRWGNITDFVDFDMITPNEREARFALADQDSTVGVLAGNMVRKTGCGTLFLKLGDRGVFVCRDGDSKLDRGVSIDSFATNVVDAVGAGDAFLAYATLVMMATGSLAMAAIIGSMAAACECEYDGNRPIEPDDVLRKIDAVEKAANFQ